MTTKPSEPQPNPLLNAGDRRPTDVIGGRFVVVEHLSTGGFGDIYKAFDLHSQRDVVIKSIREEQKKVKNTRVRFHREIRVTQSLTRRTPHVVEYVSHGQDEDYGLYYAMEHLEGQTLAQLLEESESLPLKAILKIARQLFQVLQEAHLLGIVHRDLKPANIFVASRDGEPFVKLLDFGLAKNLAGTLNKHLTLGMLGSPRYMAPEQGFGAEVDHRADIYSLGLTLYELLTHKPAFEGSKLDQVLHAQFYQMPPGLAEAAPERSFPQGLQEVLFRALQKAPEDRYPSIQAFREALEPFARPQAQVRVQAPTSPTPKAGIEAQETLEVAPQRGWLSRLLAALGIGRIFAGVLLAWKGLW